MVCLFHFKSISIVYGLVYGGQWWFYHNIGYAPPLTALLTDDAGSKSFNERCDLRFLPPSNFRFLSCSLYLVFSTIDVNIYKILSKSMFFPPSSSISISFGLDLCFPPPSTSRYVNSSDHHCWPLLYRPHIWIQIRLTTVKPPHHNWPLPAMWSPVNNHFLLLSLVAYW